MKTLLIVLDSVGIGAAPDAAAYGDSGSATLQHTAEAAGGLELPTLQKLGLGCIPGGVPGIEPISGCPGASAPLASYGALQETSDGKDTITGHWELCGLQLSPGFRQFPAGPPAFPDNLLNDFCEHTGRGVIGNKAASGTAIIEELGEEHLRTGDWIVYTSADSVMQIAAHLDEVPIEELYRACECARARCNPLKVGRVIARPFKGKPGAFVRTGQRRDYAYPPEEPLITERLVQAGIPVYAVGKIEDIVANRGITESIHSGTTDESQQAVEHFLKTRDDGLIFANFIDFDMLYGHRRDPAGYATALQQTDAWLERLLPQLESGDLLILTADHGNDPTFKGTDHTREFVPLLAYEPSRAGINLGLRTGFYDVAQTLARRFGLPPLPRGISFL